MCGLHAVVLGGMWRRSLALGRVSGEEEEEKRERARVHR
jgi:hypothetical protein